MNMKLPNQPKKPNKATQPAKPSNPARQGVGVADPFELPAWISQADRKNFYFFWPTETKLPAYTKAEYEPVLDSDGKQVRIATKDSEDDHVLVRLPMEYHIEDNMAKRERANQDKKKPKDIDGGASFVDV